MQLNDGQRQERGKLVLEKERILSEKNTDAEQTNLTQSRLDLAGR
jgi:hypothetical protein